MLLVIINDEFTTLQGTGVGYSNGTGNSTSITNSCGYADGTGYPVALFKDDCNGSGTSNGEGYCCGIYNLAHNEQ